jgi:F0F1-type ATP synthase assembly protein I
MTDDKRRKPALPGVEDASSRAEREAGISASEFAGVGLQFAAAIIVFLFGGQWLDRKLGTEPWFLIIGVFTGASAAFYSMYRKLMKAQEREEAQKRARKEQQK